MSETSDLRVKVWRRRRTWASSWFGDAWLWRIELRTPEGWVAYPDATSGWGQRRTAEAASAAGLAWIEDHVSEELAKDVRYHYPDGRREP